MILRKKSLLLGGAVLLTAAATAASAFGLASRAKTDAPSIAPPSAAWQWPSEPGKAILPSSSLAAFANQAGVGVASIHSVATAASGLSLVVGTDASGRWCTAATGDNVTNFNCLTSRSDNFAILLYSVDGGATADVTDHASVVGVARPDVARVVVGTADGSQVDLQLNQWRGFSYDASTAAAVPKTITALDGGGKTIEVEQVGSTPLAQNG